MCVHPFCRERKINLLKSHFLSLVSVNIMTGRENGSVIVAQRDFLISPRNKRCLCQWMCLCLCFDYFISVESKKLCKRMSTNNEIYAGFVDDISHDYDDVDVDKELLSGEITKNFLISLPVMILLAVLLLGMYACLLASFFNLKFKRNSCFLFL